LIIEQLSDIERRAINTATAVHTLVHRIRRHRLRPNADCEPGPVAEFDLPRVVVSAWLPRLGLTRSRVRTEIRRGNWRAIARGVVLTRPEQPTRADWAAVGIALAGPSAALTGWDALQVRGLGGDRPPTAEVTVLTRVGANRVIGRVRIRRTRRPYSRTETSAEARHHPLTPVVTTARAVADTALDCRRLSDVRALVGAALIRHHCSLDALVHELEGLPRNRGAHFRRALSEVFAGARSAAEADAAHRLARHPRIPAFELNVPVRAAEGRRYVVDFLWRGLRAALEIDSREFHISADEWAATLARHNALTAAGLSVLHQPPSAISAPDGRWLDETADWLTRRARELGVALPPAGAAIRTRTGHPTRPCP
jgi:hypothetical protein